VINLVALIIAPIVVIIEPGNPIVIVAMVACAAALIWAIWQSKREGESMNEPQTAAPVKGRA
jgi:K(+)-stimulated pyrophosphate-energized sodium pump